MRTVPKLNALVTIGPNASKYSGEIGEFVASVYDGGLGEMWAIRLWLRDSYNGSRVLMTEHCDNVETVIKENEHV